MQVGLLDIDICGPSIPKMLGLEGEEIHQSNLGWSPVYVEDNLGVMSIGEAVSYGKGIYPNACNCSGVEQLLACRKDLAFIFSLDLAFTFT